MQWQARPLALDDGVVDNNMNYHQSKLIDNEIHFHRNSVINNSIILSVDSCDYF